MKLWLCCALLVFVAGGCLAQKPRPCQSPLLFEGSFSMQVMYQIDYKHMTCQKQALRTEFHPIEIPPNSTLLGHLVLGSLSAPGEGVLVNSWAGGLPEVVGWYVMTFTEFGCLPVGLLYSVPKTDFIVGRFFNNIHGIEDPSVFIPPPFCDNATLKEGKGDFFSIFF